MTREDVRAVSLAIYNFYEEMQKSHLDDKSVKFACNGYAGESIAVPIVGHCS
jgi:hypothetical protein